MTARGDSWRTPAASAFVAERAARVPETAAQLAVLLHLLRGRREPPRRIVDLGCGGGLLLASLLDAFPSARGIGIDFAPAMLALARERLAGAGARADVVEGDLRDPRWQGALDGPVDVVVSGLAIHHLSDARKRALYGEILARLAPGGTFLNLDLVAGPTPAVDALQHEGLIAHHHAVRVAAGDVVGLAAVRQEYWARPERADDVLAPLGVQCAWLRELGYVDVDCWWKWLGLALFGGTRPCS